MLDYAYTFLDAGEWTKKKNLFGQLLVGTYFEFSKENIVWMI